MNPPTCVDLFCGAGGFSCGLQRAGFRVLKAFDHDAAAVATYRHQVGDPVERVAIDLSLVLPVADIVVGGPPCQGFSSAGARRDGDVRNTLVAVFAGLVAHHRPKAFVFENVEGFLTAEGGDRVLELLGPLLGAGYRVHVRKINAANYGLPQHRKRVVVLGGLGFDPAFPAPTHRAVGTPGAGRIGRHLPFGPSILQGLEGLGDPTAEPPGVPVGHFAPSLDPVVQARVDALRQGQTMRDLPEALWHDSYTRRAFRRVRDGTRGAHRGGAPCGLRRLVAAEPSKAITSMARAEFVHPLQDRFLTLRECARLQGFEDAFEFEGTPSEQAVLIGNAMPPPLAWRIGDSLARDLACAGRAPDTGALLSFSPALDESPSEALRTTIERVRRAFQGRLDPAEQLAFAWTS